MPDWRDEYLASIWEAEKSNPVNRELVEAYSRLQDHIAVLEAERDSLQAAAAAAAAAASAPPASAKSRPSSKRGDAPAPPPATSSTASDASDSAVVARLRLDLAESLRAQGQLQSRLRDAEQELERLRSRTAEDSRAVRQLTAERNTLATKVRDRDEELREKSKLVENVQDELIALTLQLNVTEQQKTKIQAENKELVERWMKRMGQEAEALNLANEPIFTKRK